MDPTSTRGPLFSPLCCLLEVQTIFKVIKENVTQKTFGTSSSFSFSVKSDKDNVTNAEILQALKIVDGNMSFASANGDNQRFKAMFPDSNIAKAYSQGETKVKYYIQFGIAPYFKDELAKDIKGAGFSFKFDETTPSQVKKQYDGYITYFSKNLQKVITAYVGSLFVGLFEFMKTLNLDTDFLLSIGMDGPSVNKSFKKKLINELEL